jgi:hypothetical protein
MEYSGQGTIFRSLERDRLISSHTLQSREDEATGEVPEL